MYIYNQKEINKIVGGVTFYMGGVGSNKIVGGVTFYMGGVGSYSQICTFIKLFIWIYVYSSIYMILKFF